LVLRVPCAEPDARRRVALACPFEIEADMPFADSLPHRHSLACAISVVLLSNAGAAWSSSFALLEQSSSRLGTAFAGTGAAADDATTLFYNPAGISWLEAPETTLAASAIYIDSSFENAASQPGLGQPLGSEGGNAGGWNAVPAAYFVLPLSRQIALGFGVNVPFGLSLEHDRDGIGRYQALRSEIKTYNFNPTVAWRPSERFSVGVGLDYQRVQAELTNAVNYSAVVGQGLQQLVAAGQLPASQVPALLAADANLEGSTSLRGDDAAWGFNVGVLYVAPTGTRVGLSYRSAMDYEVEGTVRFVAPAAATPIGNQIIGAARASGATLADGRASVDLELPDNATLSVLQPLTAKIALLADVAWTGWSSIQELRVQRDTGQVVSVTPEEWKDTWRVAFGATFELADAWTLRAGLARDETPVPASTRTARLPDSDRTWVAFGAQWRAHEALVIDAGYAHLFAGDVRIEQNAGNAALYGSLSGAQATAIDIVSMQLAYRFQ
jgi:long-chain fatty acid transport protein